MGINDEIFTLDKITSYAVHGRVVQCYLHIILHESQPLRQKALPHQQLSPHSQPELQIQSPPEAEGNYLGSTLMATVQFTMSLIPGL